ncbi:helix-turn-helix domain-containing protein [Fimbriiglobus ruber]|uniref:Uncharacterized protein n=1 Tax=Fimbriiglobus ruber TaxID=1908690 RepID=A0A225E4E0_9BACT|nr:helix-turn-helix domain-containing protein [Fimbriiglobus ruber]OWK43277.1 hypothetical protein FRUB_02876 [Fimbriiglobus ruber]
MKTLPAAFRHRVVALTDDGLTTSEIADVLGVSTAWVRSLKALHRSGEPLEPKSRANTRRSLAEREGERIRAHIRTTPGTTLEDLKQDLQLDTSVSNLGRALRDLKISLKKKCGGRRSGIARMWPPIGCGGRCSPTGSIPGV